MCRSAQIICPRAKLSSQWAKILFYGGRNTFLWKEDQFPSQSSHKEKCCCVNAEKENIQTFYSSVICNLYKVEINQLYILRGHSGLRMNEQTNQRTNKRTKKNEQTNKRTNKQKDKRTNKRMNEQTNE